jgi:hypothetical protein
MKQEKEGSWTAPKDKTVPCQYGGTGSAGVTDEMRKKYGRNIARIVNQTGKKVK